MNVMNLSKLLFGYCCFNFWRWGVVIIAFIQTNFLVFAVFLNFLYQCFSHYTLHPTLLDWVLKSVLSCEETYTSFICHIQCLSQVIYRGNFKISYGWSYVKEVDIPIYIEWSQNNKKGEQHCKIKNLKAETLC